MGYKYQCKKEAKELTKEKRQEYLDYIHDRLTIGEARIKAGITFNQAFGIIEMNMKTYKYLNRKSV